ncbi:hypothetical protein F5Y06DRAFT_305644 [Hypoxylon sp. FL0890]|nr:hypothetical protein F5Y06DRAFT_305644 [Hypoxylon sp. FL0890]
MATQGQSQGTPQDDGSNAVVSLAGDKKNYGSTAKDVYERINGLACNAAAEINKANTTMDRELNETLNDLRREFCLGSTTIKPSSTANIVKELDEMKGMLRQVQLAIPQLSSKLLTLSSPGNTTIEPYSPEDNTSKSRTKCNRCSKQFRHPTELMEHGCSESCPDMRNQILSSESNRLSTPQSDEIEMLQAEKDTIRYELEKLQRDFEELKMATEGTSHGTTSPTA